MKKVYKVTHGMFYAIAESPFLFFFHFIFCEKVLEHDIQCWIFIEKSHNNQVKHPTTSTNT